MATVPHFAQSSETGVADGMLNPYVTHCPLSNSSHCRTFVKNALMDNKLQIFGNKVKAFREEKGMSQEALAFKAGFDRTYISLVERGKRNLSLLNICRFAEALDVKPSELLNDF